MATDDRLQLTMDEEVYSRCLQGIDPQAESANRTWASAMIVDACVLLRLPRVTCATAQVLLHRYYCRKTMSGHDPLLIMTFTCLFLATKVEETRRKVRDVLSIFHTILIRRYGLPDSILDISSNVQYMRWRSSLLSAEQDLLTTLGFMVYTSHPHKFLLSYIQRLNGGRELAQAAWNFINDFQTSVDCLRFSPESIASAAIMLAARVHQLCLPASPPWYELFGSTKSALLRICCLMTKLYSQKAPHYCAINEEDKVALMEIEEDHRLLLEAAANPECATKPDPYTASSAELVQESVDISSNQVRQQDDADRHSKSSYRSDYSSRQRSRSRHRSRSRRRDRPQRSRSRSSYRHRSSYADRTHDKRSPVERYNRPRRRQH